MEHEDRDDVWAGGGWNAAAIPEGVDRRAFMMRSAVIGAVSVIAGRSAPEAPRCRHRSSLPSRCRQISTSEGGVAVSVTLC
jgi:hypothetical protein